MLQNFEINRGDDEELEVTVTEDGVAQDITDAVIKFTAKEDLADTDEEAVIALSTATGEVVLTDAENGLFTVYIDNETTAALSPRNYYYDIQMTLDGNKTTITYGILTVLADVTIDAA